MAQSAPIPCRTCGNTFQRAVGHGARQYCYTCRPSRDIVSSAPQVSPPPADESPGRMELAALSELDSMGRANTVAGITALMVARQLDKGDLRGSQWVSMAKELRNSMEHALAGAIPKGDTLDEMSQARERRLGA